ncbi:unnamed protein product [Thelazia callipaeda]|uniref:sn-1-specific diacylglycerol lipase n=1 Tax=Thelazia callipaeda TaxID=103827 RepID=A0A0N5CWX2_THECL|nr:unnamed protein product [Thelazia callipaeda]
MPSLVVFGRRWNIASDDFVFPSLSEVLVRLAWSDFNDMRDIYAESMEKLHRLSVLNLSLFNDWHKQLSARGSILEPHKRNFVTKVLYLRLPLFLCEMIITGTSTSFAFTSSTSCNLVIVIRLTVVLQWALIITVLISIAVAFNPSGDNRIKPSFRSESQVWTMRFKLFSLGRDEAMRSALDDIAILTTSFFADVDLVASDILAGLLLLAHAPYQPPSSVTYIPDSEPPDWMTLDNARHMAKYVAAIYGWEIYMFYNCRCWGSLRLCRKMKCCAKCSRRNSFPIRDDNCCMCATASFLTMTECEESDIIFASFSNDLFQVPFIVLTDAEAKSIIITIRGTASIMDAINDLSLDDEAFSVDVDQDPILRCDKKLDAFDEEVRVHRGMLRSARYVLEVLRANRILESLKMSHPDYAIVVCGHSLGAGVAALLTLLLKQTFDPIRCYAYSPPGCVISSNAVKETEKFVFSLYIGDDIVPRLSFQTVLKLKYDVIRSLASTNLPKYKILLRGLYRLCFSSPWQPERSSMNADDTVVNINDRLPLVFYNPMMTMDDAIDQGNANSLAERWTRRRIKLFPPGRLLHVWVVDKKDKTICKQWTHYSSLREIKLSSAVISDHLPYRVWNVLNMNLLLDV